MLSKYESMLALADLIENGSKETKFGRGAYKRLDGADAEYCAFGAAFYAVDPKVIPERYENAADILRDMGLDISYTVSGSVMQINDIAYGSDGQLFPEGDQRPRVIDWLRETAESNYNRED